MIYVTSDLHGYPLDKLKELLNKAEFSLDDFLFIIGDVIDRNNDGGVDILKWLLVQPNVELILGNHEAMLLSCTFLFEEITDQTLNALNSEKLRLLSMWQSNGAESTIKSFSQTAPETRADILNYLYEAPLYETVSIGENNFLLVHGGLENYRKDKRFKDYSEDELLWARPKINENYSTDFITIIGHTPTLYYGEKYKGKLLKTNTWINIDTGASCGLAPMLLRLDDMKEFYAD